MHIEEVKLRKVLNSFAKPTLEVEVNGVFSSLPSGTSKSKHEIGDVDVDSVLRRFPAKSLIGREVNDLRDILEIEREFLKYGNAALALSLSLVKALAREEGKRPYELFGKKGRPIPLVKIVGGGKHARGPDIQEFLVFPKKRNPKGIFLCSEFFHHVGKILREKKTLFGRDLEGGWVTSLKDLEVLKLLREEIDKGGFKLELGVDIAASSFFDGKYRLMGIKGREEMMKFVRSLMKDYDLKYVEDPLEEEDYDGFRELSKEGFVCGDDIFATNPERLRPVARAAIVKPNQVGSLEKTIEFVEKVRELNMMPIISHRSQDTEDPILTHLAIGLGIPMMKIGISGGERTAKLNELLRVS
ncbi:MAG: hypothetical protein J7L59_03150 [Nanoarchaeota archaeon]|nr:hypothetical protein [Nanoarchaeota archaeon]